LVDSRSLFRQALARTLAEEGDFIIAGEADDLGAAISLTLRKCPDVIILDAERAVEEVSHIAKRLRNIAPRARMVLLSMNDDYRVVDSILACEISAYLPKSTTLEELVSTIRSVHRDRDTVIVSIHVDSLIGTAEPVGVLLSTREREILTLVAQGLSNAQIASRLPITEGTVKRHLGNVFSKLGAQSRIDAVNKAIAMSLIPDVRIG
jgi:DNA-binding NarL/FixJ family response regulator